ncbi:dTDP-4-dehydrorhamnose 3,5-epimerase family protein [Aquibium sp. A9E412]|uniref:dTDP-4-dehydrorhamnose 3,5-epimerase family protein n=1 Tax=Aquibium sp. A9E412 TaxID=2976767 RepID=UPI0025B1D2FA|nr:dTDP-4-dehydrorhamnose 3,5-epimerase family protein [Aquibium sp. A9E412]MDN2566904.1 dTDP-4-dehydrorhamnose 3,5-epimerase family protein [Aquibium sp. A9E412]
MTRFAVHDTPLEGLKLIERRRHGDARGFFARLFCADELAALWPRGPVAQINQSFTAEAGTVRGLHFQTGPQAETKLVSCLAGAVFDVAVDVRPDSPTYLAWHGERLSADNMRSLLIPPGFAHGFQTLTEDCTLVYLHDRPHAPASEAGLNPLDPRLAVDWPLPVARLSERDRGFAML